MRTLFLLALLMAVAGCASQPAPRPTPVDLDTLTREVAAAETAFAKSMADRDIDAGKAILEFRSTWRRDPDGRWKVVFDDGTCLCGKRG